MIDLLLIEQSLAGNKQAFSQLVDRYRQQVYALAYHYTHDFEVARDLAQDTFVQAYLKLPQLREPEKFAGWLRVLTTNLCRMWLRRRQVETISFESEESLHVSDGNPGPHHIFERSEHDSGVRQAIATLPERQRLAVTMFYLGGHSSAVIAEFLNESINAVESRLHRARAQLKERMVAMIDESFLPHQLTEEFTGEVLRKVHISKLTIHPEPAARPWHDATYANGTLLLQDEEEQEFPLLLQAYEAHCIRMSAAMSKDNWVPARPITHDLFKQIIDQFGIALEQVVINDVRRGDFRARMNFRRGETKVTVEASAADAMALALQSGVPILATPAVIKKARRLKSLPLPNATEETPPKSPESTQSPEEERQREIEERYFVRQRRQRWKRVNWEKQIHVEIIQLDVDSTRNRQSAIVVLSDETRLWNLPIWMDLLQGNSIAHTLRKIGHKNINLDLPSVLPRHPTHFAHDLIKEVLDTFGVQMRWLAIDSYRNGIYYSVTCFSCDNTTIYLDARPSDALALAVRCGCPIYLERKIKKLLEVEPLPPQDDEDPFSLMAHATEQALKHIAEHGTPLRLIAARAPEGECRFQVKDSSDAIVWERSGGSFETYSVSLPRYAKFVGTETMKWEENTYTYLATVREEPEPGVEFVIKPLRDPADKPTHWPLNISESEIAAFHHEFLTRLEDGQTVGHALTALARRQENPDFEWVLTHIVTNLQAGRPFTEALSQHPQVFDQGYIAHWDDIDKRGLDLPQAAEVLRDYSSRPLIKSV